MPIVIDIPIVERRLVATGTLLVSFAPPPGSFHFSAGQYIRVAILNLLYPDSRNGWRNFSIASSPSEKGKISIVYRLSESGFKKTLAELPIGSLVRVSGPFGGLALDQKDRSVAFIAGGIGITPFMSMMKFEAETGGNREMELFYFNSSPDKAVFIDELDRLSRTNSRFVIRKFFKGFSSEDIASAASSNSERSWYIAGPSGMVFTAREALMNFGVKEERIRTEEFTGY